jgi:hypothetical protein
MRGRFATSAAQSYREVDPFPGGEISHSPLRSSWLVPGRIGTGDGIMEAQNDRSTAVHLTWQNVTNKDGT